MNRSLLSRALRLLEVQAGNRVLDLFCGIGNFSLPLACTAIAVLSIESLASLVERVTENALTIKTQPQSQIYAEQSV